jgi:2-oxoglutarate ferredoxin oxidoreductase subunit alpha
MRLNILIGGKAGQGINKVSSIVTNILNKLGYFTFNYRDYPSLIRGGHNFNVISVSDQKIGSIDSKLDGIIALDDNTFKIHKAELKKKGFVVTCKDFCNIGKNLNLSLAGALIKHLGIDKEIFLERINQEFNNNDAIKAAETGYDSEKQNYSFKKINNKPITMTGSTGVTLGAINSKIDIYFAYPMTPATNVMHELAAKETENNLIVFEPESEIAAINSAIGASFVGAKVMVGTSGGGYDLMTETLSFQGMSEIPLVVYLASRPGPGTGIPTYSTQSDLDVALRGGHGEFPRIVIAPGDPVECIEKTNEAFHLSEKFKTLSIILSDKHLAESEFSSDKEPNKILPIKINRIVPGEEIVKASSYEHDEFGNTTENPKIAKKNSENRIKKYELMKKECENFEMIKRHGKKDSKNLIIGWGSTKTVILDAIEGLDFKFLQVLYLKPLSNLIKKEIVNAKNVILIENNLTGQLGRLIREKTGIKIEKRILKYDGKPFYSDLLRKEILKLQ